MLFVRLQGPGEYSPEKAMILFERALQFTFGLRPPINSCNDTPGNITRRDEPILLNYVPVIIYNSFKLKENIDFFTFQHSAPNVYNIPSVLGTTKEGNKKTAPAYSMSGRQRVFTDDRILVPGPGSYEAIKADAVRAKSPAYSISARFQVPDDHSKIPGPGAHCPEKVRKTFC